MVRRLVLATAVTLCLSSHCAADAVRKVHVFVPFEANGQGGQDMTEENLKRRYSLQLLRAYRLNFEFQNERNQDARKKLERELKELQTQLQQLQEARKALQK